MNILFYLTRYPGVGGIETVTSQIIKALTLKCCYTIDVISHCQQEQRGKIYARNIYPMPNNKQWMAQENIIYACDVVKMVITMLSYIKIVMRLPKRLCVI